MIIKYQVVEVILEHKKGEPRLKFVPYLTFDTYEKALQCIEDALKNPLFGYTEFSIVKKYCSVD